MSQQRTGHEAGITGRVGAVAGGSGPDFPDLPEATVARLPEYLRALHHLAETGHDTVSSEGLASAAGVNSAKLRKDLSHLGSYGTRGVGYDIEPLVTQIEYILGLNKRRAVALVGVGNLGHALAGYAGFASRGFRIAALFDADTTRVGELINGIAVRHIDDIPEVVAVEGISIAVLATPAGAAQTVADQLVAAGVTSILNFAPVVLNLPDQVDVRKVDLAVELQILSFHEHRKSARSGVADSREGAARDGGGEPGGPRLRPGAARRAPAVARFLAAETGTGTGRTARGEVAA
ncbi:redox-sensing transcriptional repressor Rex [Catellatospora sp. KI3]|uniref:redox-sensing transcriptional repressor Rex n=1 Tax=Catellatospora sp. KI3 TaxID=3041620 RepID=UPI00248214D2|nr:redox-sensing transcriptional repressor Rex [Catellatospora sp. KI3]MDI1460141.1 redox-sensing transcriptional repressor Rex [Catellatospora sp. KI3]